MWNIESNKNSSAWKMIYWKREKKLNFIDFICMLFLCSHWLYTNSFVNSFGLGLVFFSGWYGIRVGKFWLFYLCYIYFIVVVIVTRINFYYIDFFFVFCELHTVSIRAGLALYKYPYVTFFWVKLFLLFNLYLVIDNVP